MARVQRNKDGVFFARLYLGTNPVSHKPIRPYKQFPAATSESEAKEMADRWEASLTAHGKTGVGLDMADTLTLYVDHLEAFGKASKTVDTYRSMIKCYFRRFLPGVKPTEFTEHDIYTFYRTLITEGGEDGDPLNRNTVRKVHSLLRGAYKWMKTEKIVAYNVMLGIEPPKPEDTVARNLTNKEFKRFMAEVNRIFAAEVTDTQSRNLRIAAFGSFVALKTGMRCSEVCALMPSAVFELERMIKVLWKCSESTSKGFRLEPPKDSSRRNITVDDDLLKRIAIEQRRIAAALDAEPDELDDVFLVSERGEMLRPSTLDDYYAMLRERAKLPKDCTFHSLRHTHASFLIAEGIDVRQVAARLGHADPATTMRIYAHVVEGRDAEAANAISGVFSRLTQT